MMGMGMGCYNPVGNSSLTSLLGSGGLNIVGPSIASYTKILESVLTVAKAWGYGFFRALTIIIRIVSLVGSVLINYG
jgi:hypothetical protein